MEHDHRNIPEYSPHPFTRQLKRLIGASCLSLTLISCGDEPRDLRPVPFNQPSSADYYLDKNDPYYAKVEKVRDQVDDSDAQEVIDDLLETPVAQWLNGDEAYSRQLIRENIDGGIENGQVPVFAVYNIPNRDLGGEASGGYDSPEEYLEWIEAISDEIGSDDSIVIYEPDALPAAPMMEPDGQSERIDTMRSALELFRDNNPNTAVYLDAGNHAWNSAQTVASIIRDIDPDGMLVGGLSLNVSNQMSEASERNYGNDINQNLGRALKILIDNSMNGAENTDELRSNWCNIEGEHVGSLEDAYYDADAPVETMFIKVPGESDGHCGQSDKPAGEFDPDLLIKQVS